MNENQPTTRYSHRISNLMHNYYAVNSIDGRTPLITQKSKSLWSSTIGIGFEFIRNGILLFKQVLKLKIIRFDIFEPRTDISLAPRYLLVKPILISHKRVEVNFDIRRKVSSLQYKK